MIPIEPPGQCLEVSITLHYVAIKECSNTVQVLESFLHSVAQEQAEQDRINMSLSNNGIVQSEIRDPHLSPDDLIRRSEICLVVRAISCPGQDESSPTGASPCSPGALTIVGHSGRHVVHHHCLQIAQINAHFEGGGAA